LGREPLGLAASVFMLLAAMLAQYVSTSSGAAGKSTS
jgi:hypothetical protein